jgi:hypothetical protein
MIWDAKSNSNEWVREYNTGSHDGKERKNKQWIKYKCNIPVT